MWNRNSLIECIHEKNEDVAQRDGVGRSALRIKCVQLKSGEDIGMGQGAKGGETGHGGVTEGRMLCMTPIKITIYHLWNCHLRCTATCFEAGKKIIKRPLPPPTRLLPTHQLSCPSRRRNDMIRQTHRRCSPLSRRGLVLDG
jgi:hypothetical protein